MTDETNSSGNGRTNLRTLTPEDIEDRTKVHRCAALFKSLKLEPLKFDNKRCTCEPVEPNMPQNRQEHRRSPKSRKKPGKEMQLLPSSNSNLIAHFNQMGNLVIHAMLHALCKQMKKDDDEQEHLFQFLYDHLESLNVLNPIGEDQCLIAMRNKYNIVFDHLLTSYGSQVPSTDLVVSKYKLPPKDIANSLSVLMKCMPKDWSAMSFLEQSRYLSQFTEICELGRGGYGKVFKAQNKVDNMIYAVKRIKLYCTNEQKLSTVQREVQVMATLKHSNIVAYFSSWWETGDFGSDSSESLEGSISSYTNSTSNGTLCSVNSRKYKGLPVTLYVQMELCKSTLEMLLEERNENLVYFKKQDPLNVVDPEFSFYIFQQILIGVEYIHSQSMMHRDLKPSNVFVDKEKRQVKIGDFGLARNEWISPIEEVTQGPYTPFPKKNCNFTAKLGTGSYAAPEQLGGSNYDKKADMYSLGFINFELFYPFGTIMERSNTMRSLRMTQGYTDELKRIEEKWPLQAEIILKLLKHDPNQRPSVHELLKMCPVRSEKEQIEQLQEQLRRRDDIINKMGDRINTQESYIRRLEVQRKRLRKRVGQLTKNVNRLSGGDSSVSE